MLSHFRNLEIILFCQFSQGGLGSVKQALREALWRPTLGLRYTIRPKEVFVGTLPKMRRFKHQERESTVALARRS